MAYCRPLTNGSGPPEPNTGTVSVAKFDDSETWYANWQSDGRWQTIEGDKEEVLAWAFSRPAHQWELHQSADPYLRMYMNPPTSWD